MAAKKTPEIIPFCHPVPVEYAGLESRIEGNRIILTATVKGIYRTGMEMEAITAASVAALTVYDMLKMLDDDMEIVNVRLLKKQGGKSDFKHAFSPPLRAAVLVLSDSISAGKKTDASGLLIRDRLTDHGLEVCAYEIIPDEKSQIVTTILRYCDQEQFDLVMTTGGTGFQPAGHDAPKPCRRLWSAAFPAYPRRSASTDRSEHRTQCSRVRQLEFAAAL
jgi:cyclic pyranopterin phosphate synthase